MWYVPGAGYCLKTPGRGGRGCLGPWPTHHPSIPHPHQKNFPQAKNEIYSRGRKFEADCRYTNLFLASAPPPPGSRAIAWPGGVRLGSSRGIATESHGGGGEDSIPSPPLCDINPPRRAVGG